MFPPEMLMSFIKNMHDVRNVCAHNNRLLDFWCRRDSNYWQPLHSRYAITPNSLRNSVFSVFISMQCFLSRSEYGTLHNKIRKRMNRLDNNLQTVPLDKFLATLSFPAGWNEQVPKIVY